MADVLTLDLSRVMMYQDEEEDDGVAEEIDPLSDEFSPDDNLPPLRRILNYYKSDSTDNRQLCVRLFPDAVQNMSTMTELNMLLQVVFTLAKDHFNIVRIGLLSNIPGLMDKNNQFALGEEEIAGENHMQLVDVLIRMLTDQDIEVRRVSQSVIVTCMNGGFDTEQKEDLLEKLFPVIKRCLGRDENYDLRMDTAMLISKMASQVGKENVIKFFLPLFPTLASDTMFHVRKAFAMSCRELCPVLEEELVEQYILPLYLPMCKDEVWGVRKACADVFSDVAICCNLGTRYDQLTPSFLKLLHDDSRWVRKAAYQSLGAFIATFYIPNGTTPPAEGEGEDGEGNHICDDSSLELLSDSLLLDNSLIESTSASPGGASTADSSSEHRHPSPNTTPPVDDGAISNSSTPRAKVTFSDEQRVQEDGVREPEFSSFEFWRSPIPSVTREGGVTSQERSEGTRAAEVGVKGRLDFADSEQTGERSSGPAINGTCGSGEGCGETPADGGGTTPVVGNTPTTPPSPVTPPADTPTAATPDGISQVTGGNSDTPSAPAVVTLRHPNHTTLGDHRSRSRSANAAVTRRVSMDAGLISHQSERLLQEKKRRRWSLNMPNHFATLPEVRIFVHSASGQVTEQDVCQQESLGNAETIQELEGCVVQGEELSDATHNYTTNKSEAMEMTLEPSTKCDEDPYMEQEIVPDELMEIYLSMTEHSRVQTVDTDLLYYCAYSLPGVTLTLGKGHWELLKPTFDYLAEDLQWKIRRVLAFSLHELARVLGSEITCRDILPVFEEYCTKDIDDVKIGTLTHLAEFLELLPADFRVSCLPNILDGLLQMENQKNWRYRNTLVEQLLLLSDLFDPKFLHRHIYPLALLLSADKVAEVRNSAGFLIGTLLQKMSEGGAVKCHALLQKLRSSLVSNSNWLQRLLYVKQCETFLLNKHISHDVFSQECLPSILQLARDRVPNVRIAIAKLLKDSVLQCEYFQSDKPGRFSLEELQITLECLQHDADRDVKFFAGGDVADTPRIVMFPKQWYTHRARSESHTSSDVEQYQDAAEYLNLDMNAISLSSTSTTQQPFFQPSAQLTTTIASSSSSSSTATQYLDSESDHTPNATLSNPAHLSSSASEYLEVESSSPSHAPSESAPSHAHSDLESDSAPSHAHSDLESGSSPDHALSLFSDGVTPSDEVPVVVEDVEVVSSSCSAEAGGSCDPSLDQSEALGSDVECSDTGSQGEDAAGEDG